MVRIQLRYAPGAEPAPGQVVLLVMRHSLGWSDVATTDADGSVTLDFPPCEAVLYLNGRRWFEGMLCSDAQFFLSSLGGQALVGAAAGAGNVERPGDDNSDGWRLRGRRIGKFSKNQDQKLQLRGLFPAKANGEAETAAEVGG
ncbi:hypothetical protein QWY85_04900 [Neolewinella lacunae]|uniref:Uncharacterized protein n=1 Tax=Neolewinella lacunae TaxID=1517758 RepID=A0A923PME8_9BACT|nr:hypothetical protein [Neolewinella lacunae]MBC6996134.1 hypothetical protein [Neolewinella lacunae]MDN3633987.1 hypothetical protein [Neolewinella lacunae]